MNYRPGQNTVNKQGYLSVYCGKDCSKFPKATIKNACQYKIHTNTQHNVFYFFFPRVHLRMNKLHTLLLSACCHVMSLKIEIHLFNNNPL